MNNIPIINGLTYISGYISPESGTQLLSRIDEAPWRADLKRRVQQYGYRYDYKARRVGREDYLGPLPEWLEGICGRLVDDALFSKFPEQAIVNEYLPGQGIAPHIDCPPCFGDTVASLSLGSQCVMEFSEPHADRSRYRLCLEPNSLLVLSGEARYRWRHAIRPRKIDDIDGERAIRGRRVSVTFRTIANESRVGP